MIPVKMLSGARHLPHYVWWVGYRSETRPEAKLIRKTLFSEVTTAPNCGWEIVAKVVGDDAKGKPRVVASDQFCCSDFLSG
jgi:hypothetical protein